MTPQTSDFRDIPFDGSLAPAVADAGPQYPVIQWSHTPGGWLLPVDRCQEFDATPPAGWERRMVTLGSNKVDCYFSPVATVSILSLVKRWFTADEQGKPTYLDKYVDGARSKTHALVLVEGSDSLFMLSAKGMTSADISSGLGKLQAAMKKAGAARPLFFFWTRIKAGDPQRLTKGATVTPAIVEVPGRTDDVLEWLKARFTGIEFVAMVERDHAEAIREFTKPREHSDAEASNGHDEQQPAPLPATGPAPVRTAAPASDDPFDAMPSATGDRAIALGLAQHWTHEAAVKWAVDLGAFADQAEGRADYSYLWNATKTQQGGRIPQLAAWWPVWIDAVLAMTDQVAVEEPGF